MSGKIHQEGLAGFKEHIDATRQHEVDETVGRLKEDNTRLKRRYTDLLRDYGAIRDELAIIQNIDLNAVAPIPVKPRTRKGSHEGMALAVASDWHVLERVLSEQVSGLNEYNKKIAERSAGNFWDGVLSWVEIHRTKLTIPVLGIALLGDIISNMLHPDQAEMNEGTPQEEILFGLDLIVGGLDYLLKEGNFERIILYCCDGNHGRDTDRIRKSNRVKHSHEWLLYQFLSRWYHNEPRIELQIAQGYHLYADIFGRKIRMHHGDEVRYQGGVGGLSIPMNKAISKWDEAYRADLDVFGHFHQFLNPTKFVSNGSMLGYSPYSIAIKAAYEPPEQSLIILDKDRWLTSVNRIYVR